MNTSIYKSLLKQENLLKLLCYYAYIGNDVSQADLEKYAIKLKVPYSSVRTDEKKLCREHYLRFSEYNWTAQEYTYSISFQHYVPVLYMLYTEYPQWEEQFRGIAKNSEPPYTEISNMVQLAIKGQVDKIPKTWFRKELLPYFLPTATHPCLGLIGLRIPEPIFYNYFDDVLEYNTENDIVDTANMLPFLLENNETLKPERLPELKESLALYRYYSHGEYTPVNNPKTFFTLLLEAVHAAHHKEYAKAVKYFEHAQRIKNKTFTEKNFLLGVLNSYFFVMSYVHEGSAESNVRLQQYLRKRVVENYSSVLPARTMASCFTNIERKLPDNFIHQLLTDDASKAKKYFGFLFTRYFKSQKGRELEAEKHLPAQAVIRHELSAFLPLSHKDKQELTECFGDAPLLCSIHSKQSWEVILENLLKEEENINKNVSTQKSVRLAYFIRKNGNIDVHEQNRLKSGQWGSGKLVSLTRYQTREIDCMDEIDEKIWSRWRKSRSYTLYIEDTLPELVGTDRLYTGDCAPYEPVNITLEKPYLVIEKTKTGFMISSNYPYLRTPERYDSSDYITVKKDDTHYVVIPLEGRQRKYYEQLLSVGEFPFEAEKSLQEFFPKVSQLVEVHSSLIEGSSTLKTQEGNSALCLQVQPLTDKFRIHARVKPLPDGKTVLNPGDGLSIIVDEKDGIRYQVKRDLSEERKNYNDLIMLVEEIICARIYYQCIVLDTDCMLTLLEYVRMLPDKFYMEWPEGEKMRLKKTAPPSKWDFTLKHNGNWFDLEGEVQLDDDDVVSAAQLLEAVRKSRGKFVKLNDKDYIRLSDNLRRQLCRLESVTVINQGKMQISNFKTGTLTDDMLKGEVTIKHDNALQEMRKKIAASKRLYPKAPTQLKTTLRGYQLSGFQWMARLNSWGAGACLADDMGLGKTVQTIAYLLYKAKEGPSLVIAPASVVPNWRKELQRFAPTLKVTVLNESDNRQAAIDEAQMFNIVLSTYSLLVTEASALTGKEWNIICLDEAHTIKNRETKTSANAMNLKGKNKLILTGTPIQNHLGELWNLFQFINPGLLGSYEHFNQDYIIPIGQNHDKECQYQLNCIVHPFMLRRTKQEVVEELPDKEEIILPVELSKEELAVYEAIRRKAKAMLAEGNAAANISALAEITRLRQAACSASLAEKSWKGNCSKIELLISLMNELKARGNRALIFSQFTSFLSLVRQSLDQNGEEYLYLDGSITMKHREKLVQEFQHGDCPFFLISLKAGGLGLNLTGANYIIHLDPWWNPAIEQQATDRAYRIGQSQKVTAYHLIASNTIEEKIMRLHETKRNIADALLEGTDISHKLTTKELLEMLDVDGVTQQ